MRVVVSQLAGLGLRTGIGHYTIQLLRCLREQAGDDTVDGFPEGWAKKVREACGRARPYLDGSRRRQANESMGGRPSSSAALRNFCMRHARQFGRSLTARYFRSTFARRRYDLYHEPNFIPFDGDFPTVTTVHDLSVLLHPEWHPADRVHHFEKNFKKGLKQSTHFLAISEFTRQEVIRTLGIRPAKVTRTYMGIRPGLGPLPEAQVSRTLQELGLPSRYLLYLGTIEPRKNILFLLRVFCSLPRAWRERWPLVLVGSWGWNSAETAEYLETEARHKGVLHLGYIAEEHLAAIYNGARALLYPSLYEGFGLPPIEMRACGGAVIAATAGAVAETIGGRALLLDPADADGWRSALLEVTENEDRWQALRQTDTELARLFTWDRCAMDTLAVYRRLTTGTLPISKPVSELRKAG
jgi:alpha-1,3-rhamnosyl/mannosyltransferase